MKQNTKKTLKFFGTYVRRYRWTAAVMLIFLIAAVTASMLYAFLYKEFFDAFTMAGDRDAIFHRLLWIVFFIFLLDFSEWICWRVAQFFNNYFQPRVMADIANDCFTYLHGHSYHFFSSNFTGALVKRVNRMARAFEGFADKIYWDIVPLLTRVTIVLVVLFSLHVLLGLILLAWTVIFLFVNYYLSLYKLKFDLAKSQADTKVTANLADTITNSLNIKLFSGLRFERKNFEKVTFDWFSKTKKSWDIGAYIEAFQALLMVILNVLVLYFAVKFWRDGLLTVGDFALIQMYLLEIFRQLWNFGRIIRDLYELLAEAEEMTVILNMPHGVADKTHARRLSVVSGKVEFRSVRFAYDQGRHVIPDLSFRVKPSEKIALVGPSGGGKSTVAKLLLRLYDVQSGEILVDDQNIALFSQDSLHQQVALVPQDPILFHRSLMENIRYGRRDASDEEVFYASKLAHCHEFIEKLPHRYETFVGERGVKLSGGERQRVAIARAILSNSRILILDEATSQLDSESEMLIQQALLNLMKNKTCFVIAHRLSTIMKMDRVFVIQDGRILEEGDHASLVTKKDSLYKRFWDLQVSGYLEM